MSWVRLDDGFSLNRKIVALSDRELRIWLHLLCYCAAQNDPTVDVKTRKNVARLTPKLITKLATPLAGDKHALLDRVGGCYIIHDWAKYQPKDRTGADRQASWRVRQATEKTVTGTVTGTVTSRARADLSLPDTRYPVIPEPEKLSASDDALAPSSTELSTRPRNPVWDACAKIYGVPTERGRKARGGLVADITESLRNEGITDPLEQEATVYRRYEALAADWGEGKATIRSLANNWGTARNLCSKNGNRPMTLEEMARQAAESHERGE